MYEEAAATSGLGSRRGEAQKASAHGVQNTVAHGDTFAGQISMMDELIASFRGTLERLTRQCNCLVPMHDDSNGMIKPPSPVKDDPSSGPLLFRMQNRNRELYELQGQIAQQLNRLEMAL